MRIYLDFNATAPLLSEAAEAMIRVIRTVPGNPSSIHTFGQQAKAEVDRARSHVASLIGADPFEVVLTGGGTEADNAAVRGAADALAPAGRRHLITSSIEHEAVLQPMRALERQGWTMTLLPVGPSGIVEPESLATAIRPDTALVSVMHANNEIGTIQPIAELAAIAKQAGALFHTDAVQSAGKIPVAVSDLGVDMLSIAAHKFGGPKGIGALWVRRGVRLLPLMTGGKQERNRRAGTENVAAIAGMGAAAEVASAKVATGEGARAVGALRDRLEAGILASVDGAIVNGDRDRRVPNTSNISFEGTEAESLLIALDLEGVAVSTGSACSSGSLEPSHVLKAMGLGSSRGRNSVRFSLGPSTTSAEIDFVIEVLPRVVTRLRGIGRQAMVTL